jgi:hypothetical protein
MVVNNYFLHGYLDEEIYMEQPQGYVQDPSIESRLKKSLYGLQ